jgi:SAM-dependent methyltransferase
MSDWDASRYHRISEPQFDWGQRVIARLQPAAGETILDLGCGTGRLTQEIARIVGAGRVIGLDRSGAMIAVARATNDGARPPLYAQADGCAVPFAGVFDAVFSAATLHWIRDHDAVFRSVHVALAPGGRFVAQCGGQGNLRRLLERAASLMSSGAYREYFRGWTDPWYFADPDSTAARLHNAGFAGVQTGLEEAPVRFDTAPEFTEFVACVCLRHQLDRLPPDRRAPFMDDLTRQYVADSAPFVLDYWRLNIEARRPPG